MGGKLRFAGLCLLLVAAAVLPAEGTPNPPPPLTEHPSSPVIASGYASEVLVDNRNFQDEFGHNTDLNAQYRMWHQRGGDVRIAISQHGVAWTDKGVVTGLLGSPRHVDVVYNRLGFANGAYFQIFYSDSASLYCTAPESPLVDFVMDIRTAYSFDGVDWFADQPIKQFHATPLITGTCAGNNGDPNAGSYGPVEVLFDLGHDTPTGTAFSLYYDGTSGGDEQTFLGSSEDGILWSARNGGAPVLPKGGGAAWDSKYATFGTVFETAGGFMFLYSGGSSGIWQGIGVALSDDGISWTKQASPVLSPQAGTWREGSTFHPAALVINGEIVVWFTGGPAYSPPSPFGGPFSIGLASTGPLTTPAPSATPPPTPIPTITPGPTPTPTPVVTPTPTPTPAPTATPPPPTPTPSDPTPPRSVFEPPSTPACLVIPVVNFSTCILAGRSVDDDHNIDVVYIRGQNVDQGSIYRRTARLDTRGARETTWSLAGFDFGTLTLGSWTFHAQAITSGGAVESLGTSNSFEVLVL